MRRLFLAFITSLAFALPAPAQDAHPAFWTIHGPKGTVYLVASLHLLPPNTQWRRPEIDAAMRGADSFVFEVPTGPSEHAEETQFIFANGLLPAGDTLSKHLDEDGKRDFRRALHLAGMEQRNLDQKQPWLAEVVLTVQSMYRRKYSAKGTPEGEAHAFATGNGRDIRYLDTTRQQLEFLQGADRSEGVEQFRTVLADFPNQPAREQRFVEAWAAGDLALSASLITAGLHDLPHEQALLNERNRDWAAQIQGMLNENRSFFIVVGMAHLVGEHGVPSLLRAAGVTIEGP
jgi:uncharacterized protein YbaP (TraB family)